MAGVLMVLELGEPLGRVALVDLVVLWLRGRVVDHQLNVLFFQVRLECVNHFNLCAVKLGPDFDAEHTLAVVGTLVEQSDAREHFRAVEGASDDTKNQFLPDLLREGQRGPEVYSELTTVPVDFVLPLGLNPLHKQAQTVDAHLLALD